ncbi:hypothetical protein TUM19329_10150 [Legionella antarctica]|uniref:Uncharacterized protein n=1 Tax=Legionella antarctica TaxID=2708020 RepID=A0A6F8T1U5_9GAMM|nr:hypothetical protein [Legionella antarctica]BCA94654.1 hypothetical protein TUM19329_10150 [Legionella antarctica]
MSLPPRFYNEKNTSNIAPEIIKKLILLRLSEYSLKRIEKEMTPVYFGQLHVLILELSQRIQKANIIRSGGPIAYKIAKKRFEGLLDAQWYADKVHAIVFGAQLLQYFTIVCDNDFDPNDNIFAFVRFLKYNESRFGNTEDNLFITEYTLIKAYNELCKYDDIYKEIINGNEKTKQMEAALSIKRLAGKIYTLEQHLALKSAGNSHHIFYQYLAFIISYTRSKITEILFELNIPKELEEEPKKWMSSQRELLVKAHTHLNALDALMQDPERLKGAEYSLGWDILYNFPEKSIERLKLHIEELIGSF